MKKIITGLSIAFAISGSAMATVEGQCPEGTASTASTPLPMFLASTSRENAIILGNSSDVELMLQMELYNDSGNEVSSSYVYGGNTKTIPALGATSFAVTRNSAATLRGILTWTAPEGICVDKPLIGTVETRNIKSSAYGLAQVQINDGKAF